jgi:small subunit ribosomal protein S16
VAVRIRLARHGRKKSPMYRVVVQDSRSARNGKTIDMLGIYNPVVDPKVIEIEQDKAKAWMEKGALPTDAVERIFEKIGLLEKKERGNTPKESAKSEKPKAKVAKEEPKAEVKEEKAEESAKSEKPKAKVAKEEVKEEPKAEVKEEKAEEVKEEPKAEAKEAK